MTKITNKTEFPNVKYVAYILDDICNGPLIRPLVNKKIERFIKNVEQHVPIRKVERKSFPLLRSAFHDAPVFIDLVGPFLTVCPNTNNESLNYIQWEILHALDCEHGRFSAPRRIEWVGQVFLGGRFAA
jgi:hypothetical protein